MSNLTYREQKDIENQETLRRILAELPPYVKTFFRGIEPTTTSRTRIAYATDLKSFFEFLKEANPDLKDKPMRDISLDIINSLAATDIEEYLEHLRLYVRDGKKVTNSERGLKRKLSSLRTFYNYLGKHDMVTNNPMLKIDTPKLHDKNIVRLEVNEVAELLDVVESGEADWVKTVDEFYQGFAKSLEKAEKDMEGKKIKVPDEETDEICEKCGRKMVIKTGRYGKFLACPGFPECTNTRRLVKDTGGRCPKCGGRMLVRRSAKGRVYYGCENYPKCEFMTWDEPVPQTCEKCGATLFKKGSRLYCAKEGCGFETQVTK